MAAAAPPRFHLHFNPTSSSWLDLIERWFAELTNRKLHRSAHRSVTELETDIRKWITEWRLTRQGRRRAGCFYARARLGARSVPRPVLRRLPL